MRLFRKRSGPTVAALQKILKGTEIPVFPQNVHKILGILRDPHSSIEEVTEALQWEPGLVVRVIGTVNSAAYSPVHTIQSVSHAATLLGRAQLEQIVLAVAVKSSLPMKAAPGYDTSRFWRAASFRAALSRAIAKRLHPAQQAECFTSGLLQDMALPVLAKARPDDYGPVLREWHENGEASLTELEKRAFGWCHGEIGGMLGQLWKLPEKIITHVEKHHSDDPSLPAALRLVALLRETNTEHGLYVLVERAFEDYGLDKDWVIRVVSKAEIQANELSASLD